MSARRFADLLRQPEGERRSPGALLFAARDPAYWRSLDEALFVCGDDDAPAAQGKERAEALREALRRQGYLRTEPLVEPALLERALRAVRAVEREGWPLVFAYVYDALWDVLRAPRVRRLLTSLLGEGFRQLPGIWLHRVPALEGARGWGPHVDVPGACHITADGRPDRLTGWIPLTDATLENGCLFVVPADEAGEIAARFAELEDIRFDDALALLHAARPLPARAGSLLLWRFDVIHWGGVATAEAKGPRLSASFEVIAAGAALTREEGFALDPEVPPSFEARLSLIGRALLAYGKAEDREPHAHRFLWLGEALFPFATAT